MITDRIVALHGPGAGEAADDAVRTFRDAVGRLAPLTVGEDVGVVADRVGADGGSSEAALFAVIGPDVVRPLSAARELRRIDGSIGLAFVVGRDAAPALEVRLGLVPELRGALVLVAEGSPQELGDALRDAASASAARREVRSAIDAMNRQLLDRGREDPEPPGRESVSESYLAALTRHMPESIVSVDRDGRIVALNDAAAGTFGLRAEDAEGVSFVEAVQPERDGDLHDLVRTALAGESTTGREVELLAGDGQRMLASVTAAAVRDHASRIVGAVLVARDITDQRRTQRRLQELQKAQSLATLAGGVAHDFNNLLVSVSGWAELAAEDVTDTEFVAEALDRIRVSSARAAELARAMLVYSGRGRFELQPVDVAEVVHEVVGLLHGTISRKTTLQLDLVDDLPTVHADLTQLRQVVTNLITNAAEALGDESGTIAVRAACVTTPPPGTGDTVTAADAYVVLAVEDTGPGMDEATRARVFEPFFTTKFEGRGLGLAASQGIVRAHGGSLQVESLPGRGATFRLVLPAAGTTR